MSSKKNLRCIFRHPSGIVMQVARKMNLELRRRSCFEIYIWEASAIDDVEVKRLEKLTRKRVESTVQPAAPPGQLTLESCWPHLDHNLIPDCDHLCPHPVSPNLPGFWFLLSGCEKELALYVVFRAMDRKKLFPS